MDLVKPNPLEIVLKILRREEARYSRAIHADPAFIINPTHTAASIRQGAMKLYVEFGPVVEDLRGLRMTINSVEEVRQFADNQTNVLEVADRTVQAIQGFLDQLPSSKEWSNIRRHNDAGTRDHFLTLNPDGVHVAYAQSFSNFGALVSRWKAAKSVIVGHRQIRENVKNPDNMWGYERGVSEMWDSFYYGRIQDAIVRIAQGVEDHITREVGEHLKPVMKLYENLDNRDAVREAKQMAVQMSQEGVSAYQQLLQNISSKEQIDGRIYLSMANAVMDQFGNKTPVYVMPALPQRSTISIDPDDTRPGDVRVAGLLKDPKWRKATRGHAMLDQLKATRSFARTQRASAQNGIPAIVTANKDFVRKIKSHSRPGNALVLT